MTRHPARRRFLLRLIDMSVVVGLAGAIVCGVVVLDGGVLPSARLVAAPVTTTTTTTLPPTTVPTTGTTPETTAPPAPPTTLGPEFRALLTGERIDRSTSDAIGGRRIIAVKIDDAPSVSTHPGLDQADLVYEVLVEAGLTRYVALFHARTPERVGPVRSVRTTDFALMGNLGVPVLAFSGGNPRTVRDAMALPVIPFPPDSSDRGVYWRDPSLESPHNLFLSTRAVWDRVVGASAPTAPFANPRTDGEMSVGDPVRQVAVRFSSSTDSTFTWAPSSRTWTREQRGAVQQDGTGRALGFENVLVMFTPYGTSPYDWKSPEAQSTGLGAGLLLNGGRARPVVWARDNGFSPFTLTAPDGAPVDLPVGRTWVALAPGSMDNVLVVTA